MGSGEHYSRVRTSYRVPDVTLVDRTGATVSLRKLLEVDEPVLLQFIFTTCTTICPAMSATFAAARQELAGDRVRMISITIDPHHDTPERLQDYASRYGAGPGWFFLTGELDDIQTVQKAFDAFWVNKMQHQPRTYLRRSSGEPWLRLSGLLSSAQLVAEQEHQEHQAE